MATFDAWAKCFGVVPGGGSVFKTSNITVAEGGERITLGSVLVGEDSSGRRGKWVWCKAAEAIVSKNVVAMKQVAAGVTTNLQMFTIEKAGTTAAALQGTLGGVVGVAEGAFDSGSFGWIRTFGLVTGVTINDPLGTIDQKQVVARGSTEGSCRVLEAGDVGQPFGFLAEQLTTGEVLADIIVTTHYGG